MYREGIYEKGYTESGRSPPVEKGGRGDFDRQRHSTTFKSPYLLC
jgi:hypothetical protein